MTKVYYIRRSLFITILTCICSLSWGQKDFMINFDCDKCKWSKSIKTKVDSSYQHQLNQINSSPFSNSYHITIRGVMVSESKEGRLLTHKRANKVCRYICRKYSPSKKVYIDSVVVDNEVLTSGVSLTFFISEDNVN